MHLYATFQSQQFHNFFARVLWKNEKIVNTTYFKTFVKSLGGVNFVIQTEEQASASVVKNNKNSIHWCLKD